MSETQQQTKTLDISPLHVLLQRIISTYHPLQVWLFGSRARGTARPRSDWDLLVVVPDDTPEELFDIELAWSVRKGSGVYADILPWKLAEFTEDFGVVNSLPHEVSRDGVLIYER